MLGHPESYFREPDELRWADRFGLPTSRGRVVDYRAFARQARTAGATLNGVFSARVMWGTLEPMLGRLEHQGGVSDVEVLEKTFGPLVFVHLRREGFLEQAVSWCRAEQTGYWQQGDIASARAQLDLNRLKVLLSEIRDHNKAWRTWFKAQAIEPLAVTYEEVVGDPQAAVTAIARHMCVDVPPTWRPQSPHRKQADEINVEHVAELGRAIEADDHV